MKYYYYYCPYIDTALHWPSQRGLFISFHTGLFFLNSFPHSAILHQTTLKSCWPKTQKITITEGILTVKSWKHCGKWKNCSFWAIPPFATISSKEASESVYIWGRGVKYLYRRKFDGQGRIKPNISGKAVLTPVVAIGLWPQHYNMLVYIFVYSTSYK